MSMDSFSESVVEQAALDWLEALDYTIQSGPEIAPPACRDEYGAGRGEPEAEREYNLVDEGIYQKASGS